MARTKVQPFQSNKVIKEQISEVDFCTYFVGFDFNDLGQSEYRWTSLINLLQDVILEFAFGFHEDITTQNAKQKLCEAAKSIYKIKEINETKEIYKKGEYIPDDDIEKEYLRRGEFGELILHLILRDYHRTIPLISKIYFKDSYGSTVHGFDAVHIDPEKKSIWLGESKLYIDGKKGVSALIKDIKEHLKRDYLDQEFAIISKRIKPYQNIPEKEHWLELMNPKTKLSEVLDSITIPLLCTYTSESFSKFKEESEEFFRSYETEVRALKKYFDQNNKHPLKTKTRIILLLFPVKCKIELVKRLHAKLEILQSINNG